MKKKPKLTANGKTVGRPRRLDESTILSVRLPLDVVDALNRYRDKESAASPGFIITRNDVMRKLLVIGLQREGIIEAQG